MINIPIKILKTIKILSILTLLLISTFFINSPVNADESLLGTDRDAMNIMKDVYSQKLPDSVFAHLKMTIIDATGTKRERILRSWVDRNKEATRSLLLFEAPADVRDAGFLSLDYHNPKKSDSQWLYLPSLHKSSRIAAVDRGGAFMGSDFSFSDLNRLGIEEFEYKLIDANATVAGEACWIIESLPKTELAHKKSGYEKTHQWISKSKKMPLQMKAWFKDKRKVKYLRFANIESIDGNWIPKKLVARTMKDSKVLSTTVLEYKSFDINPPEISDQLFTIQRLERGL